MAKSYDNLPVPHSEKLAPGIVIRQATKEDAKAMSKSFFHSFTPSHKFWQVVFPESQFGDWWTDAWRLGIEGDPTARTYIAIDSKVKQEDAGDLGVEGGRIVGFTRWIVPQHDGNLHRLWPDLPSGADMTVCGPFFGGMDENRAKLMASKPHWFLEMLGTDADYQKTGIGSTFVAWGCKLADQEDMEVYIDACEKGAPFYQRHYGAVPLLNIAMPIRPETYGEFRYVSHVRPSLSERSKEKQ